MSFNPLPSVHRSGYVLQDCPWLCLVIAAWWWALGIEINRRPSFPEGRYYWLLRLYVGPVCLTWGWATWKLKAGRFGRCN